MLRAIAIWSREKFPKGVKFVLSRRTGIFGGKAKDVFDVILNALQGTEGNAIRIEENGRKVVVTPSKTSGDTKLLEEIEVENLSLTADERDEIKSAWIDEVEREVEESKNLQRRAEELRRRIEEIAKARQELEKLRREVEGFEDVVKAEAVLQAVRVLDEIYGKQRQELEAELKRLEEVLELERPDPVWRNPLFILGIFIGSISAFGILAKDFLTALVNIKGFDLTLALTTIVAVALIIIPLLAHMRKSDEYWQQQMKHFEVEQKIRMIDRLILSSLIDIQEKLGISLEGEKPSEQVKKLLQKLEELRERKQRIFELRSKIAELEMKAEEDPQAQKELEKIQKQLDEIGKFLSAIPEKMEKGREVEAKKGKFLIAFAEDEASARKLFDAYEQVVILSPRKLEVSFDKVYEI